MACKSSWCPNSWGCVISGLSNSSLIFQQSHPFFKAEIHLLRPLTAVWWGSIFSGISNRFDLGNSDNLSFILVLADYLMCLGIWQVSLHSKGGGGLQFQHTYTAWILCYSGSNECLAQRWLISAHVCFDWYHWIVVSVAALTQPQFSLFESEGRCVVTFGPFLAFCPVSVSFISFLFSVCDWYGPAPPWKQRHWDLSC